MYRYAPSIPHCGVPQPLGSYHLVRVIISLGNLRNILGFTPAWGTGCQGCVLMSKRQFLTQVADGWLSMCYFHLKQSSWQLSIWNLPSHEGDLEQTGRGFGGRWGGGGGGGGRIPPHRWTACATIANLPYLTGIGDWSWGSDQVPEAGGVGGGGGSITTFLSVVSSE